LKTDLVLALRHDGKMQTRGEYAGRPQVADERAGPSGISNHQRDDRMGSVKGFVAEALESFPESRSHRVEVGDAFPPFVRIEDLD
jgi:hypothetical protein